MKEKKPTKRIVKKDEGDNHKEIRKWLEGRWFLYRKKIEKSNVHWHTYWTGTIRIALLNLEKMMMMV